MKLLSSKPIVFECGLGSCLDITTDYSAMLTHLRHHIRSITA